MVEMKMPADGEVYKDLQEGGDVLVFGLAYDDQERACVVYEDAQNRLRVVGMDVWFAQIEGQPRFWFTKTVVPPEDSQEEGSRQLKVVEGALKGVDADGPPAIPVRGDNKE